MSSLSARFAENVYWLARYVERAENIARIIHINETYARDDPGGPDWARVVELYADGERFARNHETADAASVVHFYVLDRDNPTSIRSAVAQARENARSVRHLISTEMWTHINMFHSRLQSMTRTDVRLANLSRLATSLIADCQTFEGIIEGTFVRGEPWCFFQAGKYLERADQTTRILDMGYGALAAAEGEAAHAIRRAVLLRSVSGYYAFRARHPAASQSSDIAMFLLYDRQFPRSVSLCVARLSERLRELQDRHGTQVSGNVEQARRALEFSLETGPGAELSPARLHDLLDQFQISLGRVSDALVATYFKH